jgi:predicted phage-related endonuclease
MSKQALQLGDEELLILDEMRQLAKNKAQIEARAKMLRAKLDDLVGEYDFFVSPDGMPVATYKRAKDSEVFDQSRFKSELPDLYSKYKTTREGSRRLLFDKSWGGI